jgi:hypothetical protein
MSCSNQQEKEDLGPIATDTIERLSSQPAVTVAVSANIAIDPRTDIAIARCTDEDAITANVTKILSANNHDEVAATMHSLEPLLRLPNNNFLGNQKTAFRRGAHLAVVHAMRRNEKDALLQQYGLSILTNISCCHLDDIRTAQDIIAVGGLESCISSMGRHLGQAGLQEAGCLLLGNFWWIPDVRKKVADAGGVEAVINAMENHKTDTLVQRRGCTALKALLVDSRFAHQMAVDAGGVDRVISAMNAHPQDADLQLHGCACLSRLAKGHEDYRELILQTKGLGPVGEALRLHSGNAQVKLAARNALAAISA